MIVNIVGWAFIIASWTLPRLIKDRQTRTMFGVTLSAIATGIFCGAILAKSCI